MSDLIFQLHTPAEFRYLSSLGHWIALLFISSVLLNIYNEPEGAYQMRESVQQNQGEMQH